MKEFFYSSQKDMLYTFDHRENKIITCNNVFLKALGYTLEQLEKKEFKANTIPLLNDAVSQQQLEKLCVQGYLYNCEGKLQACDGCQIPVIFHLTLLDKERLVLAVFQILENESSANSKNLEQINEEMHKRNEELNTLLHLITHDIKSPLRGISLISQWLMEDEYHRLSSNAQRYLKSLKQRVGRAERLLDDITEYFFHPASHNTKYEEIDFNMMKKELNSRILMPPGFQLRIKGSPGHFHTKKTPLMIILCNLMDNAIKHHHQPFKGKVTITVEESDDFYRFYFEDNGPGIPETHYDYIFGFLNKLKPKDQVEGSGIGLAIVKKLLLAEGGEISVQSREGKGTTFIFNWPKWSAA